MPAAVVGGVIAGAGAIGGAALASKAQKKASKTAAQAQLDATAQNNALAREQYSQNAAVLAPWQQRGNVAGTAVNALLGIGQNVPTPANNNSYAPIGQPTTVPAGGYSPWAFSNGVPDGLNGGSMINGRGYVNIANDMGSPGDAVNALMPASSVGSGMPGTSAANALNPNQQYQDAFANYRNSTGYQFRLGEGQRALNGSFAGRGVGQSGAAAKAALKYGQDIASGEFGNYLNQLFNVSNQGLAAANAQSGVGTNLVNAITNNNNAAAGAVAGNALAAGNASAQMWGAVGNTVGNLGSIFGSSFGNNALNSASQRLIAANPNIF